MAFDVSQVGDKTFSTSSDSPPTAAACETFGEVLGIDHKLAELIAADGSDLAAYNVYRPARLGEGDRFPVLAWGNGICTGTEAYGTLLRYIASHGFIVVAPNSRFVKSGSEILRGIDLVVAMDSDQGGPLNGHVDTARIGVMGHTEGAAGASAAASMDDRVRAAILWNGVFPPGRTDLPYLAVSADFNQRSITPQAMSTSLRAPGAYLFLYDSEGSGPLRGMATVVLAPSRVMEVAVQFFRMVLLDDAEATQWFSGAGCGLCEVAGIPAVGRHEFGATGF